MAGNLDNVISQSLDNTIQQSINVATNNVGASVGSISILLLMAKAGDIVPPWWSKRRDAQLRNFWKTSDHLSGAIYNMISKMVTIPLKIVPRNRSIISHVRIAQEYTDILNQSAEFGEGFQSTYSRWVEDYVGQDNGAMFEIIGAGNKAGPIEGPAISIAHLDSGRCTRTGNPEFPIVYTDINGRMYKLHYTRVAFASQMPSSKKDMYGVGFCAVSRAINASQNLIDIAVYKQEKLGSRPHRQIMITQGGIDPDDVDTAFRTSESSMNTQGLTRYSKTVVMGSRLIPNADVKIHSLTETWDGFDERESTILGMSVIAMALGMDARELFPGLESGATKADAIIQHIKQRGKGPGQIITVFENLLNTKFLPPFLQATFDYQDDSQDRQNAEIGNIRAQKRERDIKNGIVTTRVSRENMVESGEITQAQFLELELDDGRLEDGGSVEILFHSKDKAFVEFLGGVTQANFQQRKEDIMAKIVDSRDEAYITKGRQAIAAIKQRFETPAESQQNTRNSKNRTQQLGLFEPSKPPDTSYQQEQFGRKLTQNAVATTSAKNEPAVFQENT